ncbi:chemotaxis protein, partial [Pseudomonas chlororaphis]|nr:chemotaxis protein [Pseudomonas chlororaphis]
MFNKSLKQELLALREELSSLQQVKDSLDSEMLVLILGPDGRILSANDNFNQEMLYRGSFIKAAHALE